MKARDIKRMAATLLMAVIAAPICAQTVAERAAQDAVSFVKSDDPEMTRAFAKARATLDEFFRLAKSPKEGTTAYAVKVAVTDGQNTEFFWVNELIVDGDQVSGVLNNEPDTVKVYRMGERFSFKRAEVVDWTYVEPLERRTHGNFTACALLTHEDPAEAEEFKKQYGLSCD